MRINLRNASKEIRRFQEGGQMSPEEQGAPMEEGQPMPEEGAPEGAPEEAPQQGGDPMEQILQAAMQAVQTNDGQLALQVCGALVQLAQGGAGPEQQAPAEAPEGEPVYRRGGRLAYRRIY